jgi:hypothetical protein
MARFARKFSDARYLEAPARRGDAHELARVGAGGRPPVHDLVALGYLVHDGDAGVREGLRGHRHVLLQTIGAVQVLR